MTRCLAADDGPAIISRSSRTGFRTIADRPVVSVIALLLTVLLSAAVSVVGAEKPLTVANPTVGTEPAAGTDERRQAAVALNYCRASFHRIRKYPSRRVLVEEREKILNNLNLSGIADEEVVKLYTAVLDEIGQVRIEEGERKFIQRQYRRTLGHQIFGTAVAFGAQLATSQYIAAVRTGARSWWDYRTLTWARDLDRWQIEKRRIGAVVNKSSHFLDTFWKMTRKKQIPDHWLVRNTDLDRLEAAMREPDAQVRLRVLKRMQQFMECYPPYWYYVARTQQALGRLSAAAITYGRMQTLEIGHFRKDEMLAAGLANRAIIQDYLGQAAAAETARTAIRHSTDAWEVNLMCAKVLERHRHFAAAEDAILRNLDVNLEREQSLVQLLSLYYRSHNRKKLIARLNDPQVVAELPADVLIRCASWIGQDQLPRTTSRYLVTSLWAEFDLHFGRDDFVVTAAPNWNAVGSRITLQLGTHIFRQPSVRMKKDRLRIRFRRILDVATPLQPLPSLPIVSLTCTTAGQPDIRLILQRIPTPPGTVPASMVSRTKQTAVVAASGRGMRIVAIDVGTQRLVLNSSVPLPPLVKPRFTPSPQTTSRQPSEKGNTPSRANPVTTRKTAPSVEHAPIPPVKHVVELLPPPPDAVESPSADHIDAPTPSKR